MLTALLARHSVIGNKTGTLHLGETQALGVSGFASIAL